MQRGERNIPRSPRNLSARHGMGSTCQGLNRGGGDHQKFDLVKRLRKARFDTDPCRGGNAADPVVPGLIKAVVVIHIRQPDLNGNDLTPVCTGFCQQGIDLGKDVV